MGHRGKWVSRGLEFRKRKYPAEIELLFSFAQMHRCLSKHIASTQSDTLLPSLFSPFSVFLAQAVLADLYKRFDASSLEFKFWKEGMNKMPNDLILLFHKHKKIKYLSFLLCLLFATWKSTALNYQHPFYFMGDYQWKIYGLAFGILSSKTKMSKYDCNEMVFFISVCFKT